MLLAYTIIGSNDVARSKAFWDPVMATLGASEMPWLSSPKRVWYGRDGAGLLAIGLPYDGEIARPGNGVMIALAATDEAMVTQTHQRALEAGAVDEGQAGERIPGWFGAYFRDLDGNKVAVFTLIS